MSAEQAELVFATTAQFARIAGISDTLVRRYRRQERLVLDEQGRIVVAASLAKLGRSRDPARGGNRTASRLGADSAAGAGAPLRGGDDGGYTAASTRERLAKAQLAEIELAEKVGALVLKADVEARVFNMARAGREAIMALPDRLATVLAAQTDTMKVHELLTAACRQVCEQMVAGSQQSIEAPTS